MDRQTLLGLEYFTLLEHLSGFARTSRGAEECVSIRPQTDRDVILTEMSRTSQARTLLNNGEIPPVEEVGDVPPLLQRAAVEGNALEGVELRLLSHLMGVCGRVRSFLLGREHTVPELARLAHGIEPLADIVSRIEVAIDGNGWVTDQASPKLRRLRNAINAQKQKVMDTLGQMLRQTNLQTAWQDTVVTFRNDRYVLPVKSNSRHSVPGIIHDFSQSRATCFIEPWETVELSNELSIALAEEEEEIRRILRELTGLVRGVLPGIRQNHDLLIQLDVIFARAGLSRILKAVEPEFSESVTDLRRAIHPLLWFRTREKEERPPVPVDIKFPEGVSTLIISGPNMGGKTVALKTLGLLSLMALSGMHIPAEEGSRIQIFDGVHAVIGDDQDLLADLSTFSSQIRRVMSILEEAGSSSLVLLDEICTNTDPIEGGALALAILDQLNGQGCKSIVTTHYNTLKMYAVTRETALNVSVEFDNNSKTPTYRLNYGSPGQSNALEISRKLGLPREILDRAESYLSPEERSALNLVQDVENTYRELERERREAQSLREGLEASKSRYDRLAAELAENKERLLIEERKRASAAMRQAERRIQLALRSIRSHAPEKVEAEREKQTQEFKETRQELARELSSRKIDKPRPQYRAPQFQVGCRVRIRGSKDIGSLIGVKEDMRKVEVLVGGLRIQTTMDRLEYEGPALSKQPPSRHRLNASFGNDLHEINLIGLTVEDALEQVEKIIDQAVLRGQKRLEIIHGVGAGILRKAIREHLSEHSMVESFTHPDVRQGGVGVTTVELKS